MKIPIEHSAAVLAGIFVVMAALAWCFTWIICVIVDELAKADERTADLCEELRKELEGWK